MGLFNRKKKVADQVDDKSKDIKIEKKEVKKPKVVKIAEVKSAKVGNKIIDTRAYKVLIKPIISEKATIGASVNQYSFEVSLKANKVEIKKAIEEVYKVVPQSINIINQMGKSVRFGRTMGVKKQTKKAIVTLKKGDSIKLYEGI